MRTELSLLTYEIWFIAAVAAMAVIYLLALRPGAGRKAADHALIPFIADEEEASSDAASMEADRG